jgi:acyl carrier protein
MDESGIRKTVETGLARIAPEADFGDLPPAANLREELDIDSFDFLNFLIGLNDELGVDIPESDYELLVSMDDLVAYLKQKLKG